MSTRVLVCDDDRFIRKMVCDIMEGFGVEVIEAEDGQQALAIFQSQPLDLVIIDFLMPKIDGLQLLRQIRASGEKGRVPVVMMSAISKSQIFSSLGEAKPDGYINKPFKPNKFAKLIEEFLR
jgi:two-component system, OmpR family, response regulator ResD